MIKDKWIYVLIRSLALMVALICFSCDTSEGITGKVIAVKDGDTIEVLVGNTPYRVRLSGIDCPEKKQPYGNQAKQFSSAMVFGKTVRLDIEGQDRYQRYLAMVFTSDGKCLNQELLKAGYAWHYKQYNNNPNLAMMENQARSARRGLWSQRNPIAPWEFRRERRRR